MISVVISILLSALFCIIGYNLEIHHIIEAPAYWAFYGFVFGGLISGILCLGH